MPWFGLSAELAEVPLVGLSADDDASDMVVVTCGEIVQIHPELEIDGLSSGDVPPGSKRGRDVG